MLSSIQIRLRKIPPTTKSCEVGISENIQKSSLRFSFGRPLTKKLIEKAVKIIVEEVTAERERVAKK